MDENRKKLISSLDYFFVLRPMLFFPGWSTMLAGFFIIYRDRLILSPHIQLDFNYLLILKLFFLFAAAMGACFLLNQLKDIESDKENNKLFIVSDGYIRKSAAVREVVLLILISLLIAATIDLTMVVMVMGFIIITGFLYNYRPFSLKDKPWGSLIANSLMGFFAFAIGWLASQQLHIHLLKDSLPYVFFNTALYFFTTLPDLEGDRRNNKRTLAVIYGIEKIIIIAFVLYAVSFLTALYLSDTQALFFIVLSAPFFILALRNRAVTDAVRTTKYAILFFALMICLKFYAYFLLMVGLFFFTRWYFRARFDFDYPNFKGD